ncbi:hypothetical protein VU04_07860, partial [Desulfobulbus sp. TB]|nr:hypothetical protein [Desulfobulbus sp. TB]
MLIETILFCTALQTGSEWIKKFKKNTPRIKNTLSVIDEKYQNTVQKKMDFFFGDRRGQQFKELSSDKELPEISEGEKDANRRLGVASANLGLGTVCKVFCPYLIVVTVPFTLWLSIPRFKDAYGSLFKKHRASIAIVDSVLVTWALLSGYLFASVLGTSLITISLRLLAKTKNNYQNRLINVFRQQSRFVWIAVDNTEVEILFEELKIDDIIVVSAGETIPADGTIVKGIASVDQHLLTGESQPAEKNVGDRVFASTLILAGRIYV